jgi:hypothetical protein
MGVKIIVSVMSGPGDARRLVHDCVCGKEHVFPISASVTYEGAMLAEFLHDLWFDPPCDLYSEGVYLVPEGSASSLRQQPVSRTCAEGHEMVFKRFKSVPRGRWYCRECHRLAAERARRVAGAAVKGTPEHGAAISAGQRHRWQNPEHVAPPHLKAGASKGYKWTPEQRARMVAAARLREALKRSGIACESCGKLFLPKRSTARFCSSACRLSGWREQTATSKR